MPKLSVIIPVYNVTDYLRQCLDSVISQTLHDIEIVCVNDGSTDDSGAVLDDYAKKDSRIVVINQENQGYSCAVNAGLHWLERGGEEYISFLDSDDWVAADFYEKLVNAAEKSNADIAAGDVVYWYNQEKQQNEFVSFWTFGSGKKLLRTIDDKKEIARSCAVWNKIYRRDLIFKNNLSFYPSKDIGDFPFMFRATTLSGKIALVRDAKMYYRQRETSIMANAKKQSKIIFDAMDNHEALLKDLEILRLSDGDKNKWREILQVFTIDNILGWSFCLKPNNKSRYFSRFAVIVRDFDMDCNRYSNKWTNLIWKSASHCNASRLLKIICKDSKIIYKFFGIPVVIITNKSGRLRFYLFGKIRFYETAVSISSSR